MSVRSRLERKEHEKRDAANVDVVRPPLKTTPAQAGTSTTVRGRQEAQDFAATPETFGPNTSNFAGAGMVGTMGFNTSVRGRQSLAASKAEEKAKPAVASVADQYLAEHNARETAREAQRQADIKSGKLKILGRGEY